MVRPSSSQLSGVIAVLVLLSLLAGLAPVHAQTGRAVGSDFEGKYPPGCTPEEARTIFEQGVRKLRAEHRVAIQRFADNFQREISDAATARLPGETPAMHSAAEKLLASLRVACDAETAMLFIFQSRSRLSSQRQESAQRIADQLGRLVDQTNQAKLAYQPYVADKLRQDWETLSQNEKRNALQEYFGLSGKVPEWLQRSSSDKIAMPLPRATADQFKSFEQRAADRLRTAERALQPRRDALLARLRAGQGATAASASQRQASASLRKLLEADYGKGFRGLMLMEADTELPSDVRSDVLALLQEYRDALAALRSERATQLTELKQLLEPERVAHLREARFAELMAIDTSLHKLAQIIRPMRVLAFRDPGGEWPEDVWLVGVDDSRYHVRFLLDDREAWLPRTQVQLAPSMTTLSVQLRAPAPSDGPGSPVTDRTALFVGQSLMGYRNQTWYPVTVVDVSPFGLLISWQGFDENNPQLEPRSQLRLPVKLINRGQ